MTQQQPHGVSIIIPAYNEEYGLPDVLTELRAIPPGGSIAAIEIILVDDGSEDATATVAASVDGVTVVQHARNQGYGRAIKSGIQHASHDLICITDADGTYPNARIPDLVTHLITESLDMVVGARTGTQVRIPLIRRPAKWFIGLLANYAANTHIPDLNSGLRVFRKSVAQQFMPILPDGFSFTTTITLAMLMNDFRVAYIPTNYYKRVGRSKIKPIRDTMNFIQLVLRIALYFAPIKMFLTAALPMLLAGLFLFARFFYFYLTGEGGGHVQSLVFCCCARDSRCTDYPPRCDC